MIIFLIAVVIAAILFFVIRKRDMYWDSSDTFFTIMISVIVVILVSIIGAAVGTVITKESDNVTYELSETTQIVALKDNSAVSGHFYLGSGTVDEQTRYYYMEKTELGAHMDYTTTFNTYIVEDNSETPRIEKLKVVPDNFFLRYNSFTSYKWVIYIPEGSITTEFSVDLQ